MALTSEAATSREPPPASLPYATGKKALTALEMIAAGQPGVDAFHELGPQVVPTLKVLGVLDTDGQPIEMGWRTAKNYGPAALGLLLRSQYPELIAAAIEVASGRAQNTGAVLDRFEAMTRAGNPGDSDATLARKETRFRSLVRAGLKAGWEAL